MATTTNSKTVLVIEARYYDKIADNMVTGATPVIEAAGLTIERISVPGTFEIPAACEMAIQAGQKDPHLKYAGILALGCVIRGETTHYDYVCQESARGINYLAMKFKTAIGYGVVTAENEDQAIDRADPSKKNKGSDAANACLEMMEIKNEFDL